MHEANVSSPRDYWNHIKRHKWVVGGVLLACLAVGTLLCVVLPKSYRSTTTILVESQRIPESYVKTVVEGSIDERLTRIKQMVLSRSLLTQVAQEFRLYDPQGMTPAQQESFVEGMRNIIKVTTIDSSRNGRLILEGFTLSYAHHEPIVAMKVTERLATHFVEQNVKYREQIVEGASDFLDQELKPVQERLEAQERAISDFKTRHLLELPEQKEVNLRALDRLQMELNTTVEAIHGLTGRHGLFEKAVLDYQATGVATSPVNGASVSQPPQDPLVTRLNELNRQQAALSAEYKATYPDLVLIKKEIEEVKARIAERKEISRSEDGNPIAVKPSFDPYLQSLLRQREEAKIELGNLKAKEMRIARQMHEIEGRIERTPAREQELMVLVRDYDNQRRNYQSLLEKKLNARVAENLEKRQKGEQFRVLDPANLPATPEKPDRLRIMLMALLAGCGLGVGAAVMLEQLRGVFQKPEDVERALGLPVVATIPIFQSPQAFNESSNLKLLSHSGPPSTEERKIGKLGLLWKSKGKGEGSQSSPESLGRHFPHQAHFVTKWQPLSVAAEQFRVAATRLALLKQIGSGMVIAITSAVPGEGKSSSSINLAYTFAKNLGKSTLLVDCDLKCPVLSRYAGISPAPGVTDLLQSNLTFDACLQQYDDLPLWILPAGKASEHSLELAQMHQLMDVLREARSRYDYIIFDAPPVLPVADMHILAGSTDLLLFVVRAGQTPQSLVQRAVGTFKTSNQCCVLFNGMATDSMPYFMQYDYGNGRAYSRSTARQIAYSEES